MLQASREQAGVQPATTDAKTQAFMTHAVLSLSDAAFYPAPVLLELKDFQQVQASVFQISRSPGKNLVYLGCVLLIIGVFAMLYVRERRLWIWLQSDEHGQTAFTAALSSTRKTLDTDREFDGLKHSLLAGPPAMEPK
jgi:cytochrome c biogenesis protein